MYLCLNFLFIFRMPGRFICIGKMLILWFLGYEVLSISHTIDVSASCYFFVLVFSLHHFAFKLVLFYCIIMCKHFFLWKRGERIPTMLYFKELLGAHKNHSFSRITKFFGERWGTTYLNKKLDTGPLWFLGGHVADGNATGVSVLPQLPGTQQQEGVVGRRRNVIWPWQSALF